MRIEKPVIIVAMIVAFTISLRSVNALDSHAVNVQLTSKGGPSQPYHSKKMREKCHGLSKNMYEFGSLLNESNQKMFCGKFNDEQRKKAMQMANEKGWSGNPRMSPDQAVEKVASETSNETDKNK